MEDTREYRDGLTYALLKRPLGIIWSLEDLSLRCHGLFSYGIGNQPEMWNIYFQSLDEVGRLIKCCHTPEVPEVGGTHHPLKCKGIER